MKMPGKGAVVQFRKGAAVQLGRVHALKGEQVETLDESGHKVMLPLARILQSAGEVPDDSPQAVAQSLRALRDEALAKAEAVDLELLWQTVNERASDESIERLVEVYLGRDGTPLERLGLGFALCADTVFFKQQGTAFRPRMESEVEARRVQQQAEERAARERAAFVAWARAALTEPPGPRPEGADGPLAELEDLAIMGDEARGGRAARALLKDMIAPPMPASARLPVDAEGAIALLRRLGVFGEHENLALRRLRIPTVFPEPVLAEAAAVRPFHYDPAREPWRVDLRAQPAVTMDSASTRDRDDALFLEAAPGGGRILHVHIADPTPFIAPGSRLDEEAFRRGTTVYLPMAQHPMLPSELSEGMLSLLAGEDRPALTVRATVADDGSLAEADIVRSVIRVAENLSYDEADRRIEGGDLLLCALLDATRGLARERRARGAIDLNTFDRSVRVNSATFEVVVEIEDTRSAAHALVAECAVLANRAFAERLLAAGVPAVFRRQAPPQEPIPDPETYSSRLVWANDVRRRLGRTDVALEPGPHATLGLDAYVQATSPIRRYQDLLHHRQIAAALAGEPPPYDADALLRRAAAAESAASDVGVCERETIEYWLLEWLRTHQAEPLTGTVLGRTRDGRALVHIDRLGMRTAVRSPTRLEPGTALTLRVSRVNPRRGDLKMEVAS